MQRELSHLQGGFSLSTTYRRTNMKTITVTIDKANDHEISSDTEQLTSASVITIGRITNSIHTFMRAGVVRQSGDRYFHAIENDPALLSIHNMQGLEDEVA